MTNLTDQEKSIKLAKLCEFSYDEKENIKGLPIIYITCHYLDKHIHNFTHPKLLYETDCMDMAWRVLNWAWSNLTTVDCMAIHDMFWMTQIYKAEPEEAQRLWLDKIHELATEAGLIEVDNGQV